VDTRDMQRTPGMPPFRGINFSSLEVEADLGGLVFMVGSVLCLLIGLPMARVLFGGAFVGGIFLAVALAWWHERHPSPIVDRATIGILKRP
jgi:hypothetical protein